MSQQAENAILIAGGGIGGLAAALALARRGLPSRVFERRPSFSEEGAGIQLGPNGTRILAEIGALEPLRAHAATPDGLQVRDAVSARELARLPLGTWIAERHGAPYLTAHRQDLHAALLQAAREQPLIELKTNAQVSAAHQTREGVSAEFVDADPETGMAMIAADGVWSALRTSYLTTEAPRPAGKNAYRAVVPAGALPAGLAANDVHIWLTQGAHVVHYPVRGGAEHAFIIILDEPQTTLGWSAPVEAPFILQRTRHLAPSLRALLDAGQSWRMWSLHELAMPRRWVEGRLALLGDAAHPVLPFLAQGAVLALEDAAVLADELARAEGSPSSALERYQDKRRARALRVQAASRRNGRIYHLSGLLAAARDKVLASTPPALLMRQYDWLYGWQAN